MTNAEEKLKAWRAVYREWSDLEHRLHSPDAQPAGATAAEMRARLRALQQQSAAALAALDSAVVAMRQQGRRENIS